ITGVSVDAGPEIYGKRLQILKEAMPAMTAVAYLGLPGDWNGTIGQAMRAAGQELGLSVSGFVPAEVTPSSLRAIVAEAVKPPVNAVVVSGAGDFLAHRQLIVDLVGQANLTAMYPYRDYVSVGGLMAYAPELGDLAQRLVDVVDQILRGSKPGD